MQSPSLYLNHMSLDNVTLMNGDSLIIPASYNSIKSISVSVANREIINIPWIKSLALSDILNIVSVERENVRSVELIRRNINKCRIIIGNLIT